MKRFLLFLSVILLSLGCRKSHPDNTTIRYQFTSDASANYQLDYAVSNSSVAATPFNGAVWSQSIVVSTDSITNFLPVAKLTAYPPSTWANSTDSAHVHLSISVNGEEKISKDTLLDSANSDTGISITYTF